MPPVKDKGKSRNIKDFFKPFTIPKSRIPVREIEDEIIVTPAHGSAPAHAITTEESAASLQDQHARSPQCESYPLSSPFTRCSPSTPRLQRPDGANDHDSASPSPAGSHRRVLAAVDVPCPVLRPPTSGADKLTSATTTSFSSFSSLTSMSLSTQSSSRRIIKNGMHAVTNSDSGSADSSSSASDSELQDMSAFVPRKRPKLDAVPVQNVDPVANTNSAVKPSIRQSMRLSEGSRCSSGANTPQREITPPKTIYKHSLLNMARQRKKEEVIEVKMRQMEAEFEESERLREQETNKRGKGKEAALADDSDEGERMNLAMQRTESNGDREEFFFFEAVRDDLAHFAIPPHPFGDASHSWARRLQDEKWRAQACLTGLLAQLVAEHGLPHPLRDWLVYLLLHETREDLCDAYISIMEAGQVTTLPDGIDLLSFANFYRLHQPGANLANPGCDPPRTIQRLPLRHVVRMLRHLTVQAGDHAIGHFLLELMYTGIDATVRSDASLQCLIVESIEQVLDGAHDEERLSNQVSTAFTASKLSITLKCRAISNLPGCSKRSHALRRRLALELICADQLSESAASTIHVDAILQRLKNAPAFLVSESTDYIQLNSLIAVLDIAIDVGFPGRDLHSHDAVQASPTPKKVAFAEEPRSANSTEPENVFNAQIDSFVYQLTLMSGRVKDAGTAHLHRTEAKHAIERLAKRLEYGVRMKPRPRMKTFGGVTGEMQRTFLKAFWNGADVKTALQSGEHALNQVSAEALEPGDLDAVESVAGVTVNDIERLT